jgi:NAD(P)-dependent dehydrogenase (short-subunit alcohol dehydrogenase family)
VSKAAAMELVNWGIRVNMIHPGLIDTRLILGTKACDVTDPGPAREGVGSRSWDSVVFV